MHVHVSCPDGEAKFWLEPKIALATHYNLTAKVLKQIEKIIEDRYDEIRKAWEEHFER